MSAFTSTVGSTYADFTALHMYGTTYIRENIVVIPGTWEYEGRGNIKGRIISSLLIYTCMCFSIH